MNSQVECVTQDASVQEVAERMREHRVGSVLIVSQAKVLGIVTDRDLATRVLAVGLPASTRISSVMSGELITCAPSDDVREALRIMCVHQIRRAPVVSKGRLLGIISLSDIALKTNERDDVEITLADLCEHTGRESPEEDAHREFEARHI